MVAVFLQLFLLFISMEVIVMNIGLLLITIIGGAAGLVSTLYLTISFPAVIIWKLYRRIVHKIPVTK